MQTQRTVIHLPMADIDEVRRQAEQASELALSALYADELAQSDWEDDFDV
jgi:hypothetical protein